MSFSTQPNEILDMILNQTGIPLAQRLRLRAVSHRFLATLEDALQRETSLTIRVNHYKIAAPKADDLLIKVVDFNTGTIQLLHRLLPRITQLALYSGSLVAWQNASDFLRLYTTQLETLTIGGKSRLADNRCRVFLGLSEAINSMDTLSSLTVQTNEQTDAFCCLLPRLVPTFARLERLSVFPFKTNYTTLITVSLSSRCTHLRLGRVGVDLSKALLRSKLVDNLTHLHLFPCSDSLLQSVLQFTRLSSLTLYSIDFTGLESSFLQRLHTFPHLTDLNLINIYLYRQLELPPSKAFTFAAMSQLTVQIYPLSGQPIDGETFLRTLSVWFPKLSNCTIFTDGRFYEEIEANQNAVSYTVTLLNKPLTSRSTFW